MRVLDRLLLISTREMLCIVSAVTVDGVLEKAPKDERNRRREARVTAAVGTCTTSARRTTSCSAQRRRRMCPSIRMRCSNASAKRSSDSRATAASAARRGRSRRARRDRARAAAGGSRARARPACSGGARSRRRTARRAGHEQRAVVPEAHRVGVGIDDLAVRAAGRVRVERAAREELPARGLHLVGRRAPMRSAWRAARDERVRRAIDRRRAPACSSRSARSPCRSSALRRGDDVTSGRRETSQRRRIARSWRVRARTRPRSSRLAPSARAELDAQELAAAERERARGDAGAQIVVVGDARGDGADVRRRAR